MKGEEFCIPPSPYKAVGDKCGLSEWTIRNAFSQKGITWQTACKIARSLEIPANCFRIKEDNRGRNKKQKRCEK